MHKHEQNPYWKHLGKDGQMNPDHKTPLPPYLEAQMKKKIFV